MGPAPALAVLSVGLLAGSASITLLVRPEARWARVALLVVSGLLVAGGVALLFVDRREWGFTVAVLVWGGLPGALILARRPGHSTTRAT